MGVIDDPVAVTGLNATDNPGPGGSVIPIGAGVDVKSSVGQRGGDQQIR